MDIRIQCLCSDRLIPGLLFLRVPEEKAGKNRLHLDLRPADQAAEVARLESLGARRADVGQGPGGARAGAAGEQDRRHSRQSRLYIRHEFLHAHAMALALPCRRCRA